MKESPKSYLPVNILNIRESYSWSQTKMAHVVGVNQASISLWERGKIVPGGSALTALAALFGCTRENLFDVWIQYFPDVEKIAPVFIGALKTFNDNHQANSVA